MRCLFLWTFGFRLIFDLFLSFEDWLKYLNVIKFANGPMCAVTELAKTQGRMPFAVLIAFNGLNSILVQWL